MSDSAIINIPLQTDASTPKPAEAEFREVRFEYTPRLPEILQHLQCSLLVSTYQAGKLMVVGVDAGQFAFVGLSKIRETNIFGGLPIAERREDLRCGVAVFDLHSKQTVAVLQFHSGLEEIFAVDVVPGVTNPLFAGAVVDNQARDVWVLPQQTTLPTNS